MVGRKRFAWGHFSRSQQPGPTRSQKIYWYIRFEPTKRGRLARSLAFGSASRRSGCQENKWLGDAPSSFPTMHSPIVSTSFIFSLLTFFSLDQYQLGEATDRFLLYTPQVSRFFQVISNHCCIYAPTTSPAVRFFKVQSFGCDRSNVIPARNITFLQSTVARWVFGIIKQISSPHFRCCFSSESASI